MNVEINNLSSNPTSNTQSVQDVRFRCPCCQKLYTTTTDVFLGSAPVFDCTSCEKAFLLLNEVNEFGLYRSEPKNESLLKPCPKCSNLRPLKTDECPSCGILVSKYEALQKVESPTLFELNQIWQRVLADFTLEESHQKFINACHQKLALNFAFTKYSELKNTLGYDLACDHYMHQVELRLEQQFKAQEARQYTNSSKSYFSEAQKIFLFVGVVGVALLIFNKLRPTFPNLTGLVVAITFLSFSLVFFSADQNIKLDK